ncbi:hypothetical protein [Anaerotruncus colihominis]
MYRILAILAALSIALCFCLPVAAASYQDDCMDVLNDHIREYNGFSRNISDFIVFSGWSGCGDRSVITVDSREASATYRIDGARRVQIQLFSSQSTIAVPSNDYYRMSVRSDEELGQARRCYYDRSKDVVFIQENGRNYSLCNERRGLMLREDDSALRKDCYYGLNVFVSTDGVSYQTVNDVRLDKIESQNLEEGTGVFVRETYSAGLPSSAAYVRLVFIECAKIPGRGAADIIDRSNLHFLSKITFEGGASAPVNSSEPENGVSEPEDILPGATGGSTGKAPSGRRISNKPPLTASPPKTADVWYSEPASLEQPNEQASLAGGYEAAQTDRMPFSDFSSGDDMGITVHHNFSEGSSGRAPIPERTLYHGSVGGAGAALVIAGALKNLRR